MPCLWSVVWLVVLQFLGISQLWAQSDLRQMPKKQPDCSYNAYHTEIALVGDADENCKTYSLTITTDGKSRYDLSHFTVDVPCGTIENISNSRDWKQEIGKDPTTGLYGFKIDDISSFGKVAGDSFTVEFTFCSDAGCTERPSVVAYKFGQCVKYDSLVYEDDNDGGGDGGDNGGGDNGGGGSDGGGGDDGTCSTLLASLQQTPIVCFGEATGALEVVIETGKSPFTYSWTSGANESSISNLSSGLYAVTIMDADGNTLTLNSELDQPRQLELSGVVTAPSCSQAADGAISLSVDGGTGSYSFSWNNGATTQNLEALSAGSYVVTVSDEKGCSITQTFVLTNSTSISITGIPTKASCGQSNGAIDLTVSGGVMPYSYFWSNGATTEDIQNIKTGSYRVVVTDANGCQTIGNYFVLENSDLRITFEVEKPNCLNEPTGKIDVSVVGGVAPYTYAWLHGPVTEDVDELVSGIYRLTVTDNVGCAAMATIFVQKLSLQVTAQVVQPLCSDDTTGSIILTPQNGVPPYNYEWSNGGTGNSLSDVPAGSYTVKITDASGCSVTLAYEISAPNPIVAIANVGNSSCGENGSYFIGLTVSGGIGPYSYQWSGGEATSTITDLSTGTYQVQITDGNGCSIDKEVVIEGESFQWSCLISEPPTVPICNSVGNQLTTLVQEATSYSWSVTSSDNSWVISHGADAPSVIYSAGNANTTATFTLTIEKNGCLQTCDFVMSGNCEIRDNNGGGDPTGGDPCTEPVTVIDTDAPAETIAHEPEQNEKEDKKVKFSLEAFPNPFEHTLYFEWVADEDDYVQIEIYDQFGRLLKEIYKGSVRKNEKHHAQWSKPEGNNQLYYYRFISKGKLERGRVLGIR